MYNPSNRATMSKQEFSSLKDIRSSWYQCTSAYVRTYIHKDSTFIPCMLPFFVLIRQMMRTLNCLVSGLSMAMNPMVVLKFSSMVNGAPCVMTFGTLMTLTWCADPLVMPLLSLHTVEQRLAKAVIPFGSTMSSVQEGSLILLTADMLVSGKTTSASTSKMQGLFVTVSP